MRRPDEVSSGMRLPKPPRLAARVLLAAAALGAAFLLGEAAARVFHWMDLPLGLFTDHPERRYALRAGFRGSHPRMGDVAVNARGLRERELPLEKPAGVLRIACVGDSFTFGSGMREEEAFPRALERALGARLREKRWPGAAPPERVECVNAGVPGYNTEQELLLAREVVLGCAPDAILLIVVENDAEEARIPIEDWERRGLWPRARRFLSVRSALLNVIWKRLAGLRGRAAPSAEGWRRFREALRGFRTLGEERGMPVGALFHPRLADSPPDATLFLEEIARQGIPCVDLGPAFAGHDPAALRLGPADPHPNARACGLSAGFVAERIEELLPLDRR